MALSRKNKRKLKKLQRDANKLWAEQQAVAGHARSLLASAGDQAKLLRDTELVPSLRRGYDAKLRPGLDRVRGAAGDARVCVNGRLMPALAGLGGSLAGVLAKLASGNTDYKDAAKRARGFSRELDRRAKAAAREYDRKYNKRGIGIGGWFGIGLAVTAVGAIGYALWQTFRADDDLWIADEELDAPVTTVSPN